MKDDFLAFSEREKYNLINNFLYEDFKIDQLKQSKFISESYPLHKRNNGKFKEVMSEVSILFKSIYFGNWKDKIDVVCIYKRLLGEKYAYFIFYLINYEAFLFIPGIIGLGLFIY